MSLKKPARAKTTASPKKSESASSTKTVWSNGQMGAAAVLLAMIVVTGAAIAIGAHESPASDVTSADVAAQTVNGQPVAKKLTPSVTTTESNVTLAPEAEVTAVKTSGAKAVPATIAGCLERSDESFKLTDTDGVDVPKARSWKTGFLKKGSASVEVIDSGNRARLANHVGHRVSVTGMLSERHLQVRSVRRISATCN